MAKKEKEQEIDPALLEGLTHRSNKVTKQKDEESGRIKEVSTATEGPLKPEHVLDYVDKGDSIVIVTTDGRKHVVAKKAAKADKK